MSVPEYITPYVSMLPPNARLLVQAGIGPSDSTLSHQYRSMYPASSWLVAESDPAQAQHAREYADRVYLVDIEHAGAAFYKQLQWADCWIFDTTLEQLQAPLQVLTQLRAAMQYDACIVARVTNGNHWDAPAEGPRHRLAIGEILGLFQLAGFQVVNGVMMNPGPLPADAADTLRLRADETGEPLQALLDEAQASHYLIKAMPA